MASSSEIAELGPMKTCDFYTTNVKVSRSERPAYQRKHKTTKKKTVDGGKAAIQAVMPQFWNWRTVVNRNQQRPGEALPQTRLLAFFHYSDRSPPPWLSPSFQKQFSTTAHRPNVSCTTRTKPLWGLEAIQSDLQLFHMKKWHCDSETVRDAQESFGRTLRVSVNSHLRTKCITSHSAAAFLSQLFYITAFLQQHQRATSLISIKGEQ